MLAADMVSFALRSEGKRGGGGLFDISDIEGMQFRKSSTCVGEVSEDNGREERAGS